LALHQQAADEIGGNLLGGTGEEGWGEMVWECWEGPGGYGGGLGDKWRLLEGERDMRKMQKSTEEFRVEF